MDSQQKYLDDLRAARQTESGRNSNQAVQRACTSSSSRHGRHQADPHQPSAARPLQPGGVVRRSQRKRVARRVKQLPLLGSYMMDDSSSEEEPVPAHRRKLLKSGKVHNTDMQVLCWVTWPHECASVSMQQTIAQQCTRTYPFCYSSLDTLRSWMLKSHP